MHLERVSFQYDAVLLAFQYLQRVGIVVGGDADFEEYLVHLFSHLFGDGAVSDKHSTES